MKKRVIRWMVVVSLVLAAGVAALFVYSGWRYWYAMYGERLGARGRVEWEVGAARGRVYVMRARHGVGYGGVSGWTLGGGAGSGPASDWNWGVGWMPQGFGVGGLNWYHVGARASLIDFWQLVVPDWLLVGILMMGPAVWWRRRGEVAEGVCKECGYDLRATPGRCPECGREVVMVAEGGG